MKVQGSYVFDAPAEVVFKSLQDPQILAATMPGCDKLELVGENEYDGILNIRVGPVQGRFQGKIRLQDIEPPKGYTMLVDGKGAPGFVKATAKIAIAPDGDDRAKARLDYDGDANIGGRIASVGQRLLDSSAKSIIRQSLEGLNENLKSRQAAADGGEAPPEEPIRAPSQAEFAARVAKDVAGDLVPKPVLIGIGIAIILIVLYFLFF